MIQNYRYSPSHSEFTTSESEDIIIDEIFPGFNKTLRTLPGLSDETTHKRKVEEINECSSDSESTKELFTIDHCRTDKRKKDVSLKDGFYPCEVCDAFFKSSTVYKKHLKDRTHLKELRKIKAKIQSTHNDDTSSRVIGQIMMPDQRWSKCPVVPHGVIRRKVFDESHIQNRVERELQACPGLEHVTEIRCLKETVYYCNICNLTCSKEKILSHLEKPKHLLYSLKAISPKEYDYLASIPKSQRKYQLYSMLRALQQKDGIGRIVVQKDYLDDSDTEKKNYLQNLEMPGTSSDNQSVLCHEGRNHEGRNTYPSNSYFCYQCECSMFDDMMWESHRRGRYAKKSIRKAAIASNIRVISLPKMTEAFLVDRLGDKDHAIVGLDYIREFQHVEVKKETYHCFICADCLSFLDIMDHLTKWTHRVNYIEHINHHSVDTVRSLEQPRSLGQTRSDDQTNKSYYILGEICREIQREMGPGCPEVYLIKKSLD